MAQKNKNEAKNLTFILFSLNRKIRPENLYMAKNNLHEKPLHVFSKKPARELV